MLYNGKHMKRQGLEDEDLSDKMRLDKLLALLGEGTRSEIKAMVRAGRVTVDGRAAKDAGMQVCGEMDDIRPALYSVPSDIF